MSVPTQLYRYLTSGLTAFTVEYLLFLLLHTVIGLPLVAAHAVSFSAGLLTSFTMQRLWSFGEQRHRFTRSQQFMIYACLALFNLVFTAFVLGQLVERGLNPVIAKPTVMIAIASWNFLLYRTIIFKPLVHKRPV